MIFAILDGNVVNVDHIHAIINYNGTDGNSTCSVIYGFSKYTQCFSVEGTAEETLKNIRAQIREQLYGTPKLEEVPREALLDFDE